MFFSLNMSETEFLELIGMYCYGYTPADIFCMCSNDDYHVYVGF